MLSFSLNYELMFVQAGIITGEKSVVYQTLAWVLQNLEMLKTRAYLGRYDL